MSAFGLEPETLNGPPEAAPDRVAYWLWAAWLGNPAATYQTWSLLPDDKRAPWRLTAARLLARCNVTPR